MKKERERERDQKGNFLKECEYNVEKWMTGYAHFAIPNENSVKDHQWNAAATG